MTYLRYLCLLAYSGVQHILCGAFGPEVTEDRQTDRQYNGKKKRDKTTNNDFKTLHRKQNTVKYEPKEKPGDVNCSCTTSDIRRVTVKLDTNIL